MATVKLSAAVFLQVVLVFVTLEAICGQNLKVGFYRKRCPTAETVVRSTVAGYVARDKTISAPLLRMHFHDCFVRGCDGSVLLNSTDKKAEKDSIPNSSLDGYYVIDDAKAELEKVCPGVVSCADILALAARDAVSLIKGATWAVETGRRDGRISLADEALADLPPFSANISDLKSRFAKNGLTPKDLAVLSGAHTIGVSHCPSFEKRIYNFTGNGDVDPTLDPKYASSLRSVCKVGDTTTTVNMDAGSGKKFDTHYYKLLEKKKGLFQSDEALLHDADTKAYVHSFRSSKSHFFKEFGVSMVRMGRSRVLTGSSGEIRKNCALVN